MLSKLGLQQEEKSGSLFGGSGAAGGGAASILPSFQEESACAACCPKLSYKQRLIGFCACAALGWILSLVGTLILVGGMTPANIRAFAALYVVGNVSVWRSVLVRLSHMCSADHRVDRHWVFAWTESSMHKDVASY